MTYRTNLVLGDFLFLASFFGLSHRVMLWHRLHQGAEFPNKPSTLNAGITWLKLLFCLFLTFLVVMVERLIRWLINSAIRKMPAQEEAVSWRKHFFEALTRPLSLFIWSYGIYGALSPLYIHFLATDGSNLVHTVAEKASDIGGIIAFFWLILLLIGILDVYLKKWAAGTKSTIDDMLVPIVGKTLRLFVIVICGIIIVQNLAGLKIGSLLASLGIGGLAVALAAKDSIANFFGMLTILFDKLFQVFRGKHR